MVRYILSRLFWAIPTLVLISFISFWISNLSPTDPLDKLMRLDSESVSGNSRLSEEIRNEWQKKLHLNLPAFYFSLAPRAFPDTLYRIARKQDRKTLKSWIWQSGSYLWAQELNRIFKNIPPDDHLQSLSMTADLKKLQSMLDQFPESTFKSDLTTHLSANPKQFSQLLLPNFHWHGTNNRYHLWVKNFLSGNMGYSLTDGQAISKKIWPKVKVSLSISISAILLSLLISIPLGLWSGFSPGSRKERLMKPTLIALYSIPAFVIATLSLFTFSNPNVLHILPGSGLSNPTVYRESWNLLQKIAHQIPYLILPIATYALGLIAVLGRMVQQSTSEIVAKPFITAARAKGLSDTKIKNRHALRNVMLPIITIAFGMLPVALGGSVIIETIFSIPGMGREIYRAMLEQDHNLVVAVFTIVGALTVLGYLLADIFYSLADPRIRFHKT